MGFPHPYPTHNLTTTEEAQDGFRTCTFHPNIRTTTPPPFFALTSSTEPADGLDSGSLPLPCPRGPLKPPKTEAILVPRNEEANEVKEGGRPA